MQYTIIIEKGEDSFGAYVLELPGCVAVGETREEAEALIEEAIRLHVEYEDGEGADDSTH